MSSDSLLKDKVILVVDDEPDVLEAIADELDMCIIHKAQDYHTALESISMYTYDVVILDIMGVNGFELLKKSVEKMADLADFLEQVVLEEGKPIWRKLFNRFGDYFNQRFGPDWKEKDKFFKAFEESVIGKSQQD
jgi:hypothetical protein